MSLRSVVDGVLTVVQVSISLWKDENEKVNFSLLRLKNYVRSGYCASVAESAVFEDELIGVR